MNENDVTVEDILIYPVMYLSPVKLTECKVDSNGLKNDRNYVIVNEAGFSLSPVECPMLLRINAAIEGEVLVISTHGKADLIVEPIIDTGVRAFFKVGRKSCLGIPVGGTADAWLTSTAIFKCRLMLIAPNDDPTGRQSLDSTNPNVLKPHISIASRYSIRNSTRGMPYSDSVLSSRVNMVLSSRTVAVENAQSSLIINGINFSVLPKENKYEFYHRNNLNVNRKMTTESEGLITVGDKVQLPDFFD